MTYPSVELVKSFYQLAELHANAAFGEFGSGGARRIPQRQLAA
jgi:hypothetical protein